MVSNRLGEGMLSSCVIRGCNVAAVCSKAGAASLLAYLADRFCRSVLPRKFDTARRRSPIG
jgi:hypothetical protein